MVELNKLFGKRLGNLRKEKGLTQEQLSEKVGVSVEFISYLERGIHGPSFHTLDKIAKALGVSVKELFDFDAYTGKENEDKTHF